MLSIPLLAGLLLPPGPAPRITLYVASEAVDVVSRVHFGPEGPAVERVIPVDPRPGEADGPSDIDFSPDRQYWYTSVARGTPNGSLWKFAVRNDSLVGVATLSRFPGTIGVSPDGDFAWVANVNLLGDRVPSSVSVVYTSIMQEVARIPTCLMPHGLWVAPDGARAWTTCRMDDKVVEIDAGSRAVTRVVSVRPGEVRVMLTSSAMLPGELDLAHGPVSPATPPGGPGNSCDPTWIQSAGEGRRLYVACSRHAEVLELDAATLGILRRIPTGKSPYRLAIGADDQLLVATLQEQQALSVIDLAQGKEVARVRTSRAAPNGVEVTRDGRYAVVSCAGRGTEGGAVDLVDLRSRRLVSTVMVGAGASGVRILEYAP